MGISIQWTPRTSDIKEKLGEAIREFINQQLTSGKHLGEDGTILFPEELVNVLQVPNLDEESFLKHMHDPNSILMKSFDRDVDSQGKRGSKRREKSSRIIILKPGLAEGKHSSMDSLDLSAHHIAQSNQKYKASAPFSVASIKRKLKNVMGREQSGVSPGGLSSLNESEEVSDPCQESPIVEGEGDILDTTDDLEKEFCDVDVEITISL
ncbi:hypothetical protein MLD38_023469 [Melastoma candidum]|uniref:Uncharacterized protein n=1 Tax=Melastoma candidum TaxID=119954 RepID=A0ACB9NVV7_9MYRT|nr:hypothetical protein MLD38_023469 [Melastoma candidum]